MALSIYILPIVSMFSSISFMLFFVKVIATSEIYPLSLHDALPISRLPPAPLSILARKPAICGRSSLGQRSEEHTSELQSHSDLVCRLLLEKKNMVMASMTLVQTPWSAQGPPSLLSSFPISATFPCI